MNKKEFKTMVSQCIGPFSKTMKVSNIILNEGMIYNKTVNGGKATQYTGSGAKEKTIDYIWRKAKATGEFIIDGETIKL